MKKNLPKMEVLHNAATLAGALLVYYYFPVTGDSSPLWQVLLFAVGLGLLVWWVIRELKRQLAAGSSGVRIRSLMTLLYPLVALFALAYYLLQRSDPAQFDGLVTRTDSLYFTVITLGTIGYGDVHAVGQLARVVTMIQVAWTWLSSAHLLLSRVHVCRPCSRGTAPIPGQRPVRVSEVRFVRFSGDPAAAIPCWVRLPRCGPTTLSTVRVRPC
jgi:voltage-gated potassium channel